MDDVHGKPLGRPRSLPSEDEELEEALADALAMEYGSPGYVHVEGDVHLTIFGMSQREAEGPDYDR
ncbi:MAG: hypothetical protein EON60_02890 [Alphaproteobacteria bacterium]|nr:MAG: hypothetical protein EON60_02890 [Alphaproteobacteria bacterium]